jgi:hypothetical protein
MKWVVDGSHRFEWRPYYTEAELDSECERIVTAFLQSKNGVSCFPISTDDLAVMLESDTSDLDLYADLTGVGEDVEGETLFFPNQKPAVRIARELSQDESKYHRLRTTLAHEYGHVRFHNFLWQIHSPPPAVSPRPRKMAQQYRRLSQLRPTFSTTPDVGRSSPQSGSVTRPGACFQRPEDPILNPPVNDWMEWQAAYAAGAFLMPISILQRLIKDSQLAGSTPSLTAADSENGKRLLSLMAQQFDVSPDAAVIRLQKLQFLK